jgi:dTDP-4-amino-4,6-dideoxygalactose transaminase
MTMPAILGGEAVRPEGPPPWPRPDPAVQAALAALLASGEWGVYRGEQVPKLEAELAAFHAVPHVFTCASGTVAVEIALRALGVSPGDEVAMAAYDYESNFLTIHALGAKPVLVDVLPHNWNLDPAALEAAIGPSTKAVLASHLHGGLVDMAAVCEVAMGRGVPVVEDAAQATGATVQNSPAGTWGFIGAMSFGGSKLMTAGRGGAVLVRDPQLAQRLRLVMSRGVQPWAPLSELQAAAIRPQLAALRAMTKLRAERVGLLLRELADVPGLRPFENRIGESSPAFYKLGFQYDAATFGLPRDLFVKAMRAEGVAFDAGFPALHVGRSPSRFRAAGALHQAAAAGAGCVALHHPVLSLEETDVRDIIAAIRKVHHHRAAIGSAHAT